MSPRQRFADREPPSNDGKTDGMLARKPQEQTPTLAPNMSGLGLGRVKTACEGRQYCEQKPGAQAAIAAISGLIPTMFMTRVRL